MRASLEKSHSKYSNFKLTLLCILGIIFVNLLWIGLILIGLEGYFNFGLILSISSFLVSLFIGLLLIKFKR